MDAGALQKSVVCPVLVGRTVSVGWLGNLLERASSGKGQVVAVAGQAGVGKSRLVAELKGRLSGDQSNAGPSKVTWLEARCFESDRNLPYGTLNDLLHALLSTAPTNERQSALEPAVQELAKLVPEIGPLFPNITPAPAVTPEWEQRRLFEALSQTFGRLATQHPLVLVIEDVHCCDEASLQFLLYLSRRSASQRLLLLLTYRAEEFGEGLAHLLASLDRERLATDLRLVPLSSAEVETMLQAIFGLRRAVPTEFLSALCTLTEGNPFFVEEVLKSLLNTGGITRMGDEWLFKVPMDPHIPRSVQYVVQHRLGQLRPSAKRFAELAAVAGQHFDFPLLQFLSQQQEARVLELAKELIAAQLVVEESDERFAFRHALTRQAIYESLLARERSALHRRIADHLERSYSPRPRAHVADLAYHYYEGGVWDKALDYSREAGEEALTLFAPRAAAEYFTHALEAAEQLAAPAPAGLYRSRGNAYATQGDLDRGISDMGRALERAREVGDRRGEWEVLNDLGMLWASRDYVKTGECYREAFALAQQIGEPRVVAHSLNRIGNWHCNVEQPDAAREHHLQALATFRELNDEPGVAETLDFLGMANLLRGDLGAAVASYAEAGLLLTKLGDQVRLASGLALLTLRSGAYQVDTLVVAGPNSGEALHAAEKGLRITREIGWRAGESFALSMLGSCLGYSGRYAEALDAAQRGLAIAEEIAHLQWGATAHCILGAIYLDLLAFPSAKGHLEEALAIARQIGSLYWLRTSVGFLAPTWVGLRQLDVAERLVRATLGAATSPRTLGERQALCARAELELARGSFSAALESIEQLWPPLWTGLPSSALHV